MCKKKYQIEVILHLLLPTISTYELILNCIPRVTRLLLEIETSYYEIKKSYIKERDIRLHSLPSIILMYY